MSIFGRMMDRIFKRKPEAPPPVVPTSAAPPIPGLAPDASTATVTPPATPTVQVDIEAVLEAMAAERGEKLNWRTSIVDLMKLVGMESSLAERRELAGELGYTGDTSDTATMNIWLHKQVMRRMAENGGTVPPSLLD